MLRLWFRKKQLINIFPFKRKATHIPWVHHPCCRTIDSKLLLNKYFLTMSRACHALATWLSVILCRGQDLMQVGLHRVSLKSGSFNRRLRRYQWQQKWWQLGTVVHRKTTKNYRDQESDNVSLFHRSTLSTSVTGPQHTEWWRLVVAGTMQCRYSDWSLSNKAGAHWFTEVFTACPKAVACVFTNNYNLHYFKY